ncbi:MAG: hypothetical protein GF317_00345, partial [Candidatus Lokiarchaeota archaeon]|nr:hypothetical protein [Candidatus Lokiarchaeota archaeon]MBD3198425.1 hypothetical protein [Candidatus Lokiarchaeota archaeon]
NRESLDIRGRICPMTFVYTKLKLEEMQSGEFLTIFLDFEPALKNIPKSCRVQGLAEFIKKEVVIEENTYWKLILKKL